jgi:hypothetical protein
MKETFEQYLQRLKDRRTEDDYKYTDEDFKNYIHYIFDCYEKGMSVYKCLEFMYFVERDMDDQLFNREPKHETLEEVAERIYTTELVMDVDISGDLQSAFIEGAKWYQEQHDFLPGFIKQFEEGGEYQELTNEDWSVSQFLKWLKSNNFKIIKENGKLK